MLEVTELGAGYGRIPILTDINLSVKEGEVVGILGHNGMGKTTLLKTLMGLITPTRGKVVFESADITKAPPHDRAKRGIGYVPQGREIFPALSVMDNLRMACVARKQPESEIIEPILEEFSILKGILDRLGGALSGGEQQILAIARCLCGNPRLMLLDEPTEGIQPSIIDLLAETLHAIQEKRRATIVLVEQNLEFIAGLSDRVLIIRKGTFTQELEPAHLSDPDVVGEFIGIAG